METKTGNTKGLNNPNKELKTFAQAGMKDPMPAPLVIRGTTNNAPITKTADMMPGVMGNSTQQPTFWYSPEMDSLSWLLPKSRIETLRFCKIWYNLNPYIHSILNMHAQYGFSRFKLQCKDPKYTKLFSTLLFWNQEFDWYQFTLDAALSYYKYGECVCWGSWNSARRTWDRFTLIDPALVEYKEDLFTGHATIELIPTVEMKQTVKEAIMQGRTDIDPMLLDAVQNNKKLPLDTEGTEENVFTGQKYSPAKVFVFARRTDPSSTRGTSLIQCARGTTKVKLLDGTTPTMEELYKSGKENFWVYSIDSDRNLVFKKADKVIYKGKALTYDVTLDNGEVLGFTAEHPFMLRDGSWKLVKDLQPGDALMPLYTKQERLSGKNARTRTKYERVYDPKSGKYVLTHVKVALQEKRGDLKSVTGSRVIHHSDFNSFNNTPENLQVMTRAEHARLHLEHTNPSKEWYAEFIKKGLDAQDRVKHAEIMRDYWKDGEYRENIHRKQVAVHANRSAEEKQIIKKRIGYTNARRYDATRKAIAKRIQDAYNTLATGSYCPSFADVSKYLGNVSVATIHNYINKYNMVLLPDLARKPTSLPNFALIKKIQSIIDANPTWTQAKVSMEAGVRPSVVSYYKHQGYISVYKNHKVVSVKPAIVEDVYDIASVEDTHNFMVVTGDNSGVCVHNCLFKDLIYADMLRMSQVAVAQKTQLPIELWTVGHLGSDEQSSILPGPEMLEEVRAMITNATQQPPYSIVYGPYLKYEALGVSGKLLDIYNDLGYVENQILVGLGVNKAVVLGEGPNVQGKAISLNRLIREYATVRDLFANFVKRYILLPIAKANNLLDEDGQYIVPDLVWELSLQPEQDKEKFDMCYKMWKDGLISTMSLFEKCPEKFDYILEMKRLEEEKGSCFDKGDRRLGGGAKSGSTGGTPVASGASTSGGNVRDGKGNPDLRDFALGGNNASAINSGSDNTDVGDGANAQQGA